MTTTEDRPVTSETPVYDYTRQLAIGEGFDPEGEPQPDEPAPKALVAAQRLTTRLWNGLCREANQVDWSREDATLGERYAGNDSNNAPESGAA